MTADFLHGAARRFAVADRAHVGIKPDQEPFQFPADFRHGFRVRVGARGLHPLDTSADGLLDLVQPLIGLGAGEDFRPVRRCCGRRRRERAPLDQRRVALGGFLVGGDLRPLVQVEADKDLNAALAGHVGGSFGSPSSLWNRPGRASLSGPTGARTAARFAYQAQTALLCGFRAVLGGG